MSNTFSGIVHQNRYLAAGTGDVNAIISVKSVSAPAGQNAGVQHTGSKLVIGFVVDGSGSMAGDKWHKAKQALVGSIGKLPNGTEFFVIIGRGSAEVAVHAQKASDDNKAKALQLLASVKDGGGTKFSLWLEAARAEFSRCTGDIRVLVFLTDGENDEGGDALLSAELKKCEGIFEVAGRGVGDAYRPDQLRLIQHALGGSIDIIRRPSDLADDFAAILDRAKLLAMSDVYLQIWVPLGATIEMVKQFGAEILDLTGKVQQGASPRTKRFPTGNWGEETRDFHVMIKLDDTAIGKVGDTKLCARVGLFYSEGGQEVEVKLNEGGQVLAVWTDDEKQSAVINQKVANYTGQAELAARIQEGVKAIEAGDEERATQALQRADTLAGETGHEDTRKLIRKLADVDDQGTLRIKKKVDKMDMVELDTRSTRTARTKKEAPSKT
jgi:hypothetical protein